MKNVSGAAESQSDQVAPSPKTPDEIQADHLRRSKEKQDILGCKAFFQKAVSDLEQSNNPSEREWVKRFKEKIESKNDDEHFWFLVLKHIRDVDQTIGSILNTSFKENPLESKQQLMDFISKIIDHVLNITNLEKEIRTDRLTGLGNKRKLIEDIEERGKYPTGKSVALLYVDLDRIKIANDMYGHDNTDLIIQAVAARMNAIAERVSSNSHDIVHITPYRIGGDEMSFLITISVHITNEQYKQIIAALMNAITSEPYETSSDSWDQHVSCGVIQVSDSNCLQWAHEMVKLADGLQYLSKHTNGKSRTPPEGEMKTFLQPVLKAHSGESRKSDEKWSVVLCSDVSSLKKNQPPTVEYFYPSPRGN